MNLAELARLAGLPAAGTLPATSSATNRRMPTPADVRPFHLPTLKPARPLDRMRTGGLSPEDVKQLLGSASMDISSTLHFVTGAGGADDQQTFELIDRSGLPADARARLTVAASGGQGAQAAYDAESVLGAVQDVNVNDALATLAAFARDPGSDNARQITRVLASPTWKQASPEERQQLLQLTGRADAKGLASLAQLSQDPDKLLSPDSQGNTLLANLTSISLQSVNPAIKNTTAAQILDSVMAECADPAHTIDQSCYGTCADTSVQYDLVSQQPAEYARLIAGLSGPTGQAVTQGGDTLQLQSEYYSAAHPDDDRSPSEILFQESAEELGTDGGIPGANLYNAATDKRWDGQSGLSGAQTARLASSVMGVQYNNIALGGMTGTQTLPILQQLSAAGTTSGVIVGLTLPGGGGHALDFAGVANGKVYFRNPWGPTQNKQGDTEYGLTCEDPTTGIWSCTVAQYQQWANSVDVPTYAHAQAG